MNTEEKRDPGIPECVKVTQNQEEKMNRKREQSIRDFRRFGKYALAAAVLFPVCLYRNPAGILWPVFMGALLFLMSAVSRRERTVSGTEPERKWGMNTFYAAAVMLLSISQCMTASPVLRLLNSLGILFLLAMHLLHSFTDDRNFTIPVYCRGILHVWFLPLFHGADAVRDLYCWRKFRRNDGKQESRYTPVFTGLLVGAGLLLIVIPLLMEADLVFASLLRHLAIDFSFPRYSGDLAGILFMAAAAYGITYTVWKHLAGEQEKGGWNGGKGERKRRNPVTAITFTLPLLAVYGLFVGIQLIYLVGHGTLPEGYTYAEYVHEGFYQLLFVSILNLILLEVCKSWYEKNRWLTIILLLLDLCTGAMILSAAMRMFLYIRAYDLTFTRLFVLWFLTVLLCWLAAVTAGILKENFPVFRVCAAAGVILYLLFSLAHPDYWIASYNIEAGIRRRTEITGALRPESFSDAEEELYYNPYRYADKAYLLYNLSDDAAPAFRKDPQLLRQRAERWKEVHGNAETGWLQKLRTCNFSEAAAKKIYLQEE